MKIVVASGKGGVGKSTFTASLVSLLSQPRVVVDADVDCPDLNILFKGKEKLRRKIYASEVASVNSEKCVKCGVCNRTCEHGAISYGNVVPDRCEGCGACVITCPTKAISLVPYSNGELVHVKRQDFDLVYAELYPGNANSGKLVHDLREYVDMTAGDKLQIIDAPAGIGCPVIASITGTDAMILVIEPTKSSFHDSLRMMNVADHFRVPYYVVINKSGISAHVEHEIEKFLELKGIPLLGKIPFDRSVAEDLSNLRVPGLSELEAGKALQKTVYGVKEMFELR